MSLNEKPSPEEVLESIKLEESQRNKGRLKIFLGMAAGVGKTYAMLEEAQVLRKEQINIVVGNIEAHGRQEIESLLENLPQVPEKTIFYRDKEFKELDVDAIIRLNPSIVLVDELAHSNIAGSKHVKRWQDVQEILDHGISVHTTLNVQHIDSLKDIVCSITELNVSEIVPDAIIEKAHSIQLIDLTPDELLQRLKEGKIYTEEQSRIAMLHFFQKNKLTALREVVLRYVADKVDIDLRLMVTTKEGRLEWKTREKFLVAINSHPQSQKLIRTARRLALQANSSWIAVYVNTGKPQSKEEEEQLAKNQSLTRSLGAEVVTVYDADIAEGIKRVAYQRNITQIVLGRTPKNPILSLFQGPTLLDKLAAECKNVDLHVIRQEKHLPDYRKKWSSYLGQSKFADYFYISLLVSLIASLSWAGLFLLGYKVVRFLFFISVCLLSFFFKIGPTILAVIIFGLIWGSFFIPFSSVTSPSHTDDWVLLTLYMLTSISIAIFVDRLWKQRKIVIKGDKQTSQLTEILHCLESNLALQDILVCLEEHLPGLVEGSYKFVIKNKEGTLDLNHITALTSDKERIAALWAFENGRKTGWSTDALPLSENLYIPLIGPQEKMGLLIYHPPTQRILTVEERNLIDNVCHRLSIHLEKSFL